ncbi:hypothetical protein Syun_000438 [Stephania yunnanensis]|uniref:SKP1 component POZ domain-containing protein n=1 Tax=Stephania yunnanensis TaxID=152371 RepID=A0AAP0LC09_9MAGN
MKKEEMVTLISAEGFEFVIDKKAAMVSQTIRNMELRRISGRESDFSGDKHRNSREDLPVFLLVSSVRQITNKMEQRGVSGLSGCIRMANVEKKV